MPNISSYDIVAVLRHLIGMLQPVAKSEAIRLSFHATPARLPVAQDTTALITGLTTLLCKIINYVPSKNDIRVRAEQNEDVSSYCLRITIENTGINLSRLTALKNNHINVTIIELPPGTHGTRFQVDYPLTDRQPVLNGATSMQLASLPAYYAEIRKRFVMHFSKKDRLVAALENVNPREAAFLRKVNTLISENIGNPLMDANFVSNALHLSRTQLFRKLKPIIRQSPGNYIKALKLQKAKDLLETTDLRINEVAFKCGFESPSHFTKAFVRHFGVKPSLFCRTKCNK